jgi:hypothetical protein
MKEQVQAYRGLRTELGTMLTWESTYCSTDSPRGDRSKCTPKAHQGQHETQSRDETYGLLKGAETQSLPDPKWEDLEGDN